MGLRTYSDEEIELMVKGEPAEVYRVILHGISNINTVLIPHIQREEELFLMMGEPETIKQRSAWIDVQITKQKNKNEMMRKVAAGVALWAVIGFVLFMMYAAGEFVFEVVRVKLVTGKHITELLK